MKKPITKLATVAVIIIVVLISLSVFTNTSATAAEILSQAVKAASNLKSVHMTAWIRTRPGGKESFDFIGMQYDFVKHEMWKEFGGQNICRWRIENEGRIEVMDGYASMLFIQPNYAKINPHRYGYSRLRKLLDVDEILDSEFKLAQNRDSELILTHEKTLGESEKLILTVEAKAMGDFTNDWCRNTSITTSDNRRVYCFSADTKLLELLEVYVKNDNNEEILVLEISDIEYNVDVNPELFTISLPENVIWFKEPEASERYSDLQSMSPEEVARAFFRACSEEDWDRALTFKMYSSVPDWLRNKYGSLEIIKIGEPFKSGLYPGWFVPYEIKFKDGRIRKMNLAVRNDNPAKRYIIDGGL